ncbi:hypothetical protein GCM10011452_27110 [Gemmobacter lanyuensis]|uniref:Periplasmic heavy metal sensor n=1 Tax=Gemmobacter lanyuensis TaxID=1054497 RepID=A0A918IZ05_9RHOB|nr:periplasmic heavy metal sensor [Gemmobacter lanyuensis]GGW37310.1 hypothetical protein GCM10011452_27110 [Gemmobacter lanyuensis]
MAELPSATRWKRAFFASLAVNLLVLGMVGGAILKGPPLTEKGGRDLGFGPYAAALDDSDRKELRRVFLERGPGLSEMRARMQGDMAAVVAVLRAEPFDANALRAALDGQRMVFVDQIRMGQGLLADHLTRMTPEARRAFADRLEQSLKRGGHGDDRHHDEGNGR